MPLTIPIRKDGPPPYEQVRDGLIRAIERGRLLPGDRVPTVRGLAHELDLAPNTIARAYHDLTTAGWLVGRGRAGTFVADPLSSIPSGGEVALAAAADRYLRRAAMLGFDATAARAMLDRA